MPILPRILLEIHINRGEKLIEFSSSVNFELSTPEVPRILFNMDADQRLQLLQFSVNLDAELCQYEEAIFTVMEQERQQEKAKKKRLWQKPWRMLRPTMSQFVLLMGHLRVYDERSFQNMTRFKPDQFFSLLAAIEHRIIKQTTNYRRPLAPDFRLAVALRYYASGAQYVSMNYNWIIGHNTISKILTEVSQAIWDELAREHLSTPETPEEWLEVANAFSRRWNFHHTLGALDGKHIAIRCPPNSGSRYFNYKRFYSIILMALVDANYKFLWVDIGANGGACDAQVWNSCRFKALIEREEMGIPEDEPLPGDDQPIPYFLVGDDAFALSSTMMKPHGARKLQHDQKVFNYRLSRARRIVENAFGILANRFQCLFTTMRQMPHNTEKIVMAICILHNRLRDAAPRLGRGMVDEEDWDHDLIKGRWRKEGHLLDALGPRPNNTGNKWAKDLRDYLTAYYNSEVGEVEWQNRMVDKR